jgi:hypothetical protein
MVAARDVQEEDELCKRIFFTEMWGPLTSKYGYADEYASERHVRPQLGWFRAKCSEGAKEISRIVEG